MLHLTSTRRTVRSISSVYEMQQEFTESLKCLLGYYAALGNTRDMFATLQSGKEPVAEAAHDAIRSFAAMPGYNEAWKVVKSAYNRTSLKEALRSNGNRVGVCAVDLLSKSMGALPAQEIEVRLCVRSVGRLGFEFGASYPNICHRVLALGFGLCPEWLAPVLRVQYKEQPEGERLHVVMRPVIDSVGRVSIFSLVHDEMGLHLLRINGDASTMYGPDALFVYVQPHGR